MLPFSFKPKIENIYKIVHFNEDKNFCILIEIRHCFGFSILRLEHLNTISLIDLPTNFSADLLADVLADSNLTALSD